jgi:hypothetical protein
MAQMTTENLEAIPPPLETSRTMWILFGFPFPVIAVICAIEALALGRARGLWFPAIALGLISVVHLSWLKTARLELADGAVRYRALFVRKNLDLAEIVCARFEFGLKGRGLGPMQRMVFELRAGERPAKVTINAGLFDNRQARRWVADLNHRLNMSLGREQ